MIYFLDASALVKRYVHEPGSEQLRALARRQPELAISRISTIEIPAALARRVREGDLDRATARSHIAQLSTDTQEIRIVEVRTAVLELASELVWRRPLRAYDSLQLASALRLHRSTGLAITFVCADRILSAAATGEGLRVRRLG
jgi:hypothetical protein